MKVHEIMTSNVRSVPPDATLVEAAGLMRELDVGALPVCDGDKLAGMVTDRDMVVRGLADGMDAQQAKVRDVMSGGVEFVNAEDDVENAVRLMERRQIRRLPVLNREEKLVGMVSLGDIATSSNPAFSGLALRDVSEPNEPSARRRRLARQSEPARMPRVPGERRGPGNPDARARRATAKRASAQAGGKTRVGRAERTQQRKGAGAATRKKQAGVGKRAKKTERRSRK